MFYLLAICTTVAAISDNIDDKINKDLIQSKPGRRLLSLYSDTNPDYDNHIRTDEQRGANGYASTKNIKSGGYIYDGQGYDLYGYFGYGRRGGVHGYLDYWPHGYPMYHHYYPYYGHSGAYAGYDAGYGGYGGYGGYDYPYGTGVNGDVQPHRGPPEQINNKLNGERRGVSNYNSDRGRGYIHGSGYRDYAGFSPVGKGGAPYAHWSTVPEGMYGGYGPYGMYGIGPYGGYSEYPRHYPYGSYDYGYGTGSEEYYGGGYGGYGLHYNGGHGVDGHVHAEKQGEEMRGVTGYASNRGGGGGGGGGGGYGYGNSGGYHGGNYYMRYHPYGNWGYGSGLYHGYTGPHGDWVYPYWYPSGIESYYGYWWPEMGYSSGVDGDVVSEGVDKVNGEMRGVSGRRGYGRH